MITFDTANPQQLLASLKEAISNGRIETWSDQNGDFTHKPGQWVHKAWLRPSIKESKLRFAIIRPKNLSINSEVYAVYHGRFIEMMLAHFDQQFSNGAATALPIAPDQVAG